MSIVAVRVASPLLGETQRGILGLSNKFKSGTLEMTQYLTNSPELKKYRQDLRNNLTKAEVTLWKYLKSKQLEGRKFRRQFSVRNYILDFYCVEENLAIELDGQEHYSEAGYESDLKRSNFLREQGIRVLRFENEDVFKNTEEVLGEIKKHFTRK